MIMKITKIIAIGLFVVAMVLNVCVYVDSGNSQKADLSIGDLRISLFEKAYASSGDGCWECAECDWGFACCGCAVALYCDAVPGVGARCRCEGTGWTFNPC